MEGYESLVAGLYAGLGRDRADDPLHAWNFRDTDLLMAKDV